MTVVPLPDTPCVRVRLDYTVGDGALIGSRFYLSYAGSAPTPGNCATLASDISTAWGAHLAVLVYAGYALTEVDVLDLATDSGASGNWEGSVDGTNAGDTVPGNAAVNVEFQIARRYRGGKPRMFLPPPAQAELLNPRSWNNSFITTAAVDVPAFFSAVEALSIGAMGALQHINLSYYKGFTNITNSSGRTRAAPKYRDTALHDNITGYEVQAVVGSQRRRRNSTSY